ncbi:hypothetical protein JHK85_006524 [Glycine max]|nr:hypothetical protein JHK85_006524 [Glycine max]
MEHCHASNKNAIVSSSDENACVARPSSPQVESIDDLEMMFVSGSTYKSSRFVGLKLLSGSISEKTVYVIFTCSMFTGKNMVNLHNSILKNPSTIAFNTWAFDPLSFIPNSIYIASSLQVFDLSLNNIYGTIISCLMRMSVTLKVLNLKNNNLTGHIPYAISASCSLWILNLHGNLLDGPIPNSFSCCLKLKESHIEWYLSLETLPCLICFCSVNSPGKRKDLWRFHSRPEHLQKKNKKQKLERLQKKRKYSRCFKGERSA